jgi:hypothetical protein
VAASLSDVKRNLGGFAAARRELLSLPEGYKRAQTIAILTEADKYLNSLIATELDRVFGPYLKIRA